MENFLNEMTRMFASLPAVGFLAAVFLISYVENLFPPSPSDILLVFAGTILASNHVHPAIAVLVATIGSTAGFLSMYWIGRGIGQGIMDGKLFPFLKKETIAKTEGLIRKYGYTVIVANRFLSGTRAVISFAAGLGRLNVFVTTLLCFVSAGIWNTLMVLAGTWLGSNWKTAGTYIHTYGAVITTILVAAIVFFIARWLVKRKGKKQNAES